MQETLLITEPDSWAARALLQGLSHSLALVLGCSLHVVTGIGSLQYQMKLYHAVAQTGHDPDTYVCKAAADATVIETVQAVQAYDTVVHFVAGVLQHSLAALNVCSDAVSSPACRLKV